jgi:hypothetical protein
MQAPRRGPTPNISRRHRTAPSSPPEMPADLRPVDNRQHEYVPGVGPVGTPQLARSEGVAIQAMRRVRLVGQTWHRTTLQTRNGPRQHPLLARVSHGEPLRDTVSRQAHRTTSNVRLLCHQPTGWFGLGLAEGVHGMAPRVPTRQRVAGSVDSSGNGQENALTDDPARDRQAAEDHRQGQQQPGARPSGRATRRGCLPLARNTVALHHLRMVSDRLSGAAGPRHPSRPFGSHPARAEGAASGGPCLTRDQPELSYPVRMFGP